MNLLQLLAAHRAVENADDLLTSAGAEIPDPQHTLAVHGDLQETILSRVRIESSEIIVVSATEGTGLTAGRSTLNAIPELLLRHDMFLGPFFASTDDVSVVTRRHCPLSSGREVPYVSGTRRRTCASTLPLPGERS